MKHNGKKNGAVAKPAPRAERAAVEKSEAACLSCVQTEFVLDADEARAFYEATQLAPKEEEISPAIREVIERKRSGR